MWPLLLGLWKARRGRKAAVAVIAPFVQSSRQRLNGIPASAWLDPYLVGFMVMFITLVARRQVDALDSQALGLVQSGAWGDITGLKSDLIGEETLHCCETGNRDFERGCRDAISLDLALHRSNADFSIGGLPDSIEGRDAEVDEVMHLWEHCFDTQVLNVMALRNVSESAAAFSQDQAM